MILLKLFCIFFIFCFLDAKKEEPKNSFVNEPVELAPVFHKSNAYEERSYDFWHENWPQPHVHGDQPRFDERHQHFKGYGDNYDFSNFITDPPTQNGIKSEHIAEIKKDYGADLPAPISIEKLTKPVKTPDAELIPAANPGYSDDRSSNRNPINEQKQVYPDETSSKLNGSDYTDLSNPVPPSSTPTTNSGSGSYSGDSDVGGGTKNDYFKSPPGTQPELFPEVKLNPDNPYAPVSTPTPQPETKPSEGFSENSYGGEESEQKPVTLSPTPVQPEIDVDSGPRPCCPCCKEPEISEYVNRNNIGGGGGGCGGQIVSEEPTPVFDNCPPPPIVGSPPNCCPQAPLPCCPTLPNCCIPQLPCCPRIQIPCCPPIQVCCQPLVPSCNSGCRSRAITRVRTKRLGCVPCIGRKKREIFDEIVHIRQKRFGCIPCLYREKRHIPQQNGCQKCNNFQQHIVRRVKRTFSCSSCATHHERMKRQTQIADFYRGNQLGTHRNCEQCLEPPTFRRPVMKRFAGFENSQNKFLNRIKRVSDGYDPLFKCDSSCCDYSKCIKSKPLKQSTYKVSSDDDFISDANSADYDLSHTKELNLKTSDIDSLIPNDESTSSKNAN